MPTSQLEIVPRGRYLIIFASDRDLQAGSNQPSPYINDFGGGADGERRKYGDSKLHGVFTASTHDRNGGAFPWFVRTNEEMPENMYNLYSNLNTPEDVTYIEPFHNQDIIHWLKSRGYLVDVAVLNRSKTGVRYYTDPELIPDLSEIPNITYDWTRMKRDYGEGSDGLGPNGYPIFNCTFGTCYWSPSCLLAHIQAYRKKYQNSSHPLRHVLFVGAPCSSTFAEGNWEMECIPMWSVMSYSFKFNANVTDWPYQAFSYEFVQQLVENNIIHPTPPGEHYDVLSNLDIDDYDSMVTACESYTGQLYLDAFDINGVVGYTTGTFANSVKTEMYNYNSQQTPAGNDVVDNLSSFWRPDYNLGRIGALEQSHGTYAHMLEQPIGNSIAYHNFQVLETSPKNMDFCKSADGGIPAYGYCNITEAECVIEEEDALYVGCAHGYCEWFSTDCGTPADVDHYKEYLGNTRHIGYNYAGD